MRRDGEGGAFAKAVSIEQVRRSLAPQAHARPPRAVVAVAIKAGARGERIAAAVVSTSPTFDKATRAGPDAPAVVQVRAVAALDADARAVGAGRAIAGHGGAAVAGFRQRDADPRELPSPTRDGIRRACRHARSVVEVPGVGALDTHTPVLAGCAGMAVALGVVPTRNTPAARSNRRAPQPKFARPAGQCPRWTTPNALPKMEQGKVCAPNAGGSVLSALVAVALNVLDSGGAGSHRSRAGRRG